MIARQRLSLILLSLALATGVPLGLGLHLFSTNRWLMALGILILADSFGAGVILVRRVRQLRQHKAMDAEEPMLGKRHIWLLTGVGIGLLFVPIGGMVMHTVFAVTLSMALTLSCVIGWLISLVVMFYGVKVTQ